MRRVILNLMLPALLLTGMAGCVTVSVNSATKDVSQKNKVDKVFVLATCDSQYVSYFKRVINHLKTDFAAHNISSDGDVQLSTESYDGQVGTRTKIQEFKPENILKLRIMKSFEAVDESHVDEDLVLDVQLNKFGEDKSIWRSSISVNSGGIWGFGTVESGTGGKMTASRIIQQMEADKVIPVVKQLGSR